MSQRDGKSDANCEPIRTQIQGIAITSDGARTPDYASLNGTFTCRVRSSRLWLPKDTWTLINVAQTMI